MSGRKTRVTVDLSEPDYAALGKLETATGADSKADVIRDALKLYGYVAAKMAAGAKFQVAQGGAVETVVIFNLLPAGGTPSARDGEGSGAA